MLPALAIAFAATAATATETGSRRRALAAGGTRTQRITSFLPFVNVDGEAVITTPVSLQYHDDQLTVRGAAKIPNE